MDFIYSKEEAEALLQKLDPAIDTILIDGGLWTPDGDAPRWSPYADAALAVCGQDKAEFEKTDRMMEDLEKGSAFFAGGVLNGFV